ncbi:MAG: hypothetical protein K0R94_234 [Burkholderiales bacterium]|jgi:hypothetical protein|nr:hypothetical protein [Burkholderiales bacterium]
MNNLVKLNINKSNKHIYIDIYFNNINITTISSNHIFIQKLNIFNKIINKLLNNHINSFFQIFIETMKESGIKSVYFEKKYSHLFRSFLTSFNKYHIFN